MAQGHPFFMAHYGILGAGWLMQKWILNRPKDQFTITTRTGISPIPAQAIVKTIPFQINEHSLNKEDWEGVKCIICSIPFSGRTPKEENEVKAKALVKQLQQLNKPIIFLSSTGVYSPEPNTYTEESQSLTESIQIAEQIIQQLDAPVTILRLGGLMGAERYLSKYIQTGNTQVVNHIHYEDAFRAIEHIAEKQLWNTIFNVVAPEHPSQQQVISYQLHQELIDKEEIESPRIIDGSKLQREAFTFTHPNPIYFK